MSAESLDRMIKSLFGTATRRGLLRFLAVVAGLAAPNRPPPASARKRKKGSKKPKPNAFGCLDVGKACAGKNSKCCSGICQGKKPKKGEKDKSRCVAHNTGGCTPGEQSCGADVPDMPCGTGGFCLQTTGNAGFCGDVVQGACAACRRDADCQVAFGEGAACVICGNNDLCPETDDRACVTAAA